jgi:hypothetical protein
MKLTRRKTLTIGAILLPVCVMAYVLWAPNQHSLKDAARIKKGMTIPEVEAILGPSEGGWLNLENENTGVWEVADGDIVITFIYGPNPYSVLDVTTVKISWWQRLRDRLRRIIRF